MKPILKNTVTHENNTYIYNHIYIYIHIHRERERRNETNKIRPFNRRMQIECLLTKPGRPHSYDLGLFESQKKNGQKALFISHDKVAFEACKSKLVKSKAQMNISIAMCNNDLKYASHGGFLTG